jgi:hypothetical protein
MDRRQTGQRPHNTPSPPVLAPERFGELVAVFV